MSLKNIFICYRRDDAEGYAGRIYDRLIARFPGRIFRDVDGISPGADFTRVIQDKIGACHALLAIIGRQWLTITDESNRRRLDLADDFVRNEIATALYRNITIIPVLVRGAKMPSREQLPPDIGPLSTRNAIEITETDFDHDVQRLIAAIEYALGETRPTPSPPSSNTGRNTCLIVGIVGVIAAVIIGFVVILATLGTGSGTVTNPSPTPEVNYSAEPTYMPTQPPLAPAREFHPVGSWIIQVEGQGQSNLDMDASNRYQSSNEQGTWTYGPPYLRLDGYVYNPGMEPQPYSAVITVEGWDGSRFVGTITTPRGVFRMGLVPND